MLPWLFAFIWNSPEEVTWCTFIDKHEGIFAMLCSRNMFSPSSLSRCSLCNPSAPSHRIYLWSRPGINEAETVSLKRTAKIYFRLISAWHLMKNSKRRGSKHYHLIRCSQWEKRSVDRSAKVANTKLKSCVHELSCQIKSSPLWSAWFKT